jgi:hypothetical protein
MSLVTEAETAVATGGMSLLTKACVYTTIAVALIGVGAFGMYRYESAKFTEYVDAQKLAAQKQKDANGVALDTLKTQQAATITSIHSEYTENAQHLQAARDAALAAAASYAGKLQQYIASSHQRASLPSAASAPAGTADAPQGGLLDGLQSLNWYLTQRFTDADDNTDALNEAIAILIEDRKICTGALPGVSQ